MHVTHDSPSSRLVASPPHPPIRTARFSGFEAGDQADDLAGNQVSTLASNPANNHAVLGDDELRCLLRHPHPKGVLFANLSDNCKTKLRTVLASLPDSAPKESIARHILETLQPEIERMGEQILHTMRRNRVAHITITASGAPRQGAVLGMTPSEMGKAMADALLAYLASHRSEHDETPRDQTEAAVSFSIIAQSSREWDMHANVAFTIDIEDVRRCTPRLIPASYVGRRYG
ncbi:hypothetical protein [Bordetella sp. LUAb4]|uniref:hypothetical protein n=1 Tax=Bordetella sp. LUAb4 TaxID=2843195 RepID=UPI001E5F3772|nr:hypothetical protein [Bordetella sp. LUAb4]